MTQIKRYITIVLLIASAFMAAQNTNSPFTRYGYGALEDACFSKSRAMGGTAMGLRSKNTINPLNPASYSSLDSTTFIFEIGASALWSNFATTTRYNNTFTANLDYIALQTPITKWLGLSAGVIPFSYVGYKYSYTDSIAMPGAEEHNVYQASFSGKGGISQVYLGLSFDIAHHLSIGANGYYLFGNLTNYRSIGYTQSSMGTQATVYENNLHVRSFNGRFGLQYHETIGSKHAFTIGAIYEFKSPLQDSIIHISTGADTVQQTSSSSQLFQLPSVYGGGFSYTYENRIMIAADYQFHQYSRALYFGKTDTLGDYHKIAIGAEYMHRPTGFKYIDRVAWRVGANVRQNYTKTTHGSAPDFSICIGVGLPLRTSKTLINVNLEYSNIGAFSTTLKEQYLKLGINFALNEIWFIKSQIR